MYNRTFYKNLLFTNYNHTVYFHLLYLIKITYLMFLNLELSPISLNLFLSLGITQPRCSFQFRGFCLNSHGIRGTCEQTAAILKIFNTITRIVSLALDIEQNHLYTVYIYPTYTLGQKLWEALNRTSTGLTKLRIFYFSFQKFISFKIRFLIPRATPST